MSTGQKFLSGIILGVAVGAAIILVSKTDKGKEIWSDIEDATDDIKYKAKNKYSDAKDKYSDVKESAIDKYSSLAKDLKSLLKKGKSFIEDLEDKAKSFAD